MQDTDRYLPISLFLVGPLSWTSCSQAACGEQVLFAAFCSLDSPSFRPSSSELFRTEMNSVTWMKLFIANVLWFSSSEMNELVGRYLRRRLGEVSRERSRPLWNGKQCVQEASKIVKTPHNECTIGNWNKYPHDDETKQPGWWVASWIPRNPLSLVNEYQSLNYLEIRYIGQIIWHCLSNPHW